jgi:hypothetical protein
MQFQKITSSGKSKTITNILIKFVLAFLLFFIAVVLINKIDFPSPSKKIEKTIPNENLKVVK